MSGVLRSSRLLAFALAPVVVNALLPQVASALERRPVAAVTIYPGDIIREQMLADENVSDSVAGSAFATNHTMLIGKVARRTLLPGQPIPTNVIGDPKLVTVGAMVRLVYVEDGLQISTYATALQAGVAGDFVSVRNKESGITVGGVVQADGSIHVGPS